MKKDVFIFIVLFLAACTGHQHLTDGMAMQSTEDAKVNTVKTYREQARNGNAQAYLKLANCYHYGDGVQRDFLNTFLMAYMAEEYGAIKNAEDYFRNMADEEEYKMMLGVFEAMTDKHERVDTARLLTDKMLVRDMTEGYTAQGLLLLYGKDTISAEDYLQRAAKRGSTLAEFVLANGMAPQINDKKSIGRLDSLGHRLPLAYISLARAYMDDRGMNASRDSIVANYLMKAYNHAYLPQRYIHRLLDYHLRGSVTLDDGDRLRLEKLAE